jgi:hypothetical protein
VVAGVVVESGVPAGTAPFRENAFVFTGSVDVWDLDAVVVAGD